jgi:hypothetical protein
VYAPAASLLNSAAGQQLRAVAVELVRRGLRVALVDYLDGWSELEATLPQAPHRGPVTVDRDADGTTCQLAWDCWADITTPSGTGQVAHPVPDLSGYRSRTRSSDGWEQQIRALPSAGSSTGSGA